MLAGSRNDSVNGVWVWAKRFAEVLEERGVAVKVTFNGALGSEADRTELTALALAAVNDTATSEIIARTETYTPIGLPFFFDSADQFDRFISDPEFLEPVQRALAPSGLMIADAALLGSMSGLFTSDVRVSTLEDLNSVRLRAMGRTDLAMIEALGASGVQVAWEEVPQALQTGIAQGYFNPPLAPVMFGHGSQIHHFCALRSGIAHRVITLSRHWFQSLSGDLLDHVRTALSEAHKANRAWAASGFEKEMQALASIGVEVTTPDPEERARFVERARQAYSRMAPPEAVQAALRLLDRIGEGK
ncbi:MAG TPA: TRAP transporter substrate-binding protein DctP [Hyphomonas sp.]|nr:TRAP transporter substrate-binding protein DctP [Hyphomonas sp.]